MGFRLAGTIVEVRVGADDPSHPAAPFTNGTSTPVIGSGAPGQQRREPQGGSAVSAPKCVGSSPYPKPEHAGTHKKSSILLWPCAKPASDRPSASFPQEMGAFILRLNRCSGAHAGLHSQRQLALESRIHLSLLFSPKSSVCFLIVQQDPDNQRRWSALIHQRHPRKQRELSLDITHVVN